MLHGGKLQTFIPHLFQNMNSAVIHRSGIKYGQKFYMTNLAAEPYSPLYIDLATCNGKLNLAN